MSSFQKYVAIGTLGRDPEIRSTPSGVKVANFSIALDKGFGDKKKVVWINCVAFKDKAEFAEKYLKKGKTVSLSGELDVSSWDDKETSKKVWKTEVQVSELNFFDTRSDSGSSSSRTSEPARRTETPVQTRAAQPVEDPFADEGLEPF